MAEYCAHVCNSEHKTEGHFNLIFSNTPFPNKLCNIQWLRLQQNKKLLSMFWLVNMGGHFFSWGQNYLIFIGSQTNGKMGWGSAWASSDCFVYDLIIKTLHFAFYIINKQIYCNGSSKTFKINITHFQSINKTDSYMWKVCGNFKNFILISPKYTLRVHVANWIDFTHKLEKKI